VPSWALEYFFAIKVVLEKEEKHDIDEFNHCSGVVKRKF
jgi:hypothetical protein